MFASPEGATPITPEEREDLLPPHINTRDELNAWEQEGILRAELKFFAQRKVDFFDESFLKSVHREMFKATWKWAGKYRTSERNIGVPPWEIAVKVRGLMEDVRLWAAPEAENPDEAAMRYHHRLVFIHPFPNGNGRHARLLADLLLVKVLKRPRFTWGRGSLEAEGQVRQRYLRALRAADSRDWGPLREFVRS